MSVLLAAGKACRQLLPAQLREAIEEKARRCIAPLATASKTTPASSAANTHHIFWITCLYAGPYKTALSQYIPAWQSGFAQRMPLPRKDLRLQDRGKPSALSSENVG